jgi:hypothetical protein
MPEVVTGNPEFRLTGIILHTLLYAAYRDGIPRTGPFFDQKDSFGLGWWPHLEIVCQSKESVVAHIDDPVFGTLAIFNDNFSLFKVQHTQGEMGDFFNAKPTPDHQHEHGPIPVTLHNVKKDVHLLISQMPGEGFGHFEGMILTNWIHDGYMLLFT